MFAKRMLYLSALIAAVAFHLFYTEYDSYLILTALLALPLLSLAFSLRAMLGARITLTAPATVRRQGRAELTVRMESGGRLPVGGARLQLVMKNRFTGASPYPAWAYLDAGCVQTLHIPLDTAHCGCIECAAMRVRVFDHLGLFALPVRRAVPSVTTVLPEPIAPDPVPPLFNDALHDLKPKHGGGFSEEHDLRPYREGDALVSVHQKLSAKLDALIVREPMEPRKKPVVLAFRLCGTPRALDAALSELVWLSTRLSEGGHFHLLRWRDGAGKIHTERMMGARALETLLRRMLSTEASKKVLPYPHGAGTVYRIGATAAEREVKP